jgi:DNA-binding Xre family transcriptional regulator
MSTVKKATRKKTDDGLWAAFARGIEDRDREAKEFARGPGRLADDPDFRLQVLMTAIAAELERAMEAAGIESYAELGKRLGTSRQNAHKMLKQIEASNFKMETLARLSVALDCEVEVKFRPRARAQAAQPEHENVRRPAGSGAPWAVEGCKTARVVPASWVPLTANEPAGDYGVAPAAAMPCPILDLKRLAA